MIDSNSQFFAILTAVGEAKQANANALGVPWKLTQMGVGDASGTDPIPNRLQTRLINERRRALLNQLKTDPANPSVLVAEQVIPADVGGWWVREIGLYDSDGDLVAVANCAPSFKPLLAQGSGRTQIVRMNFIVSSITNVVLKIDPAIVLATREYVDLSIDSVLPANKTPGTYFQVTTDKRGVVQSGRNPSTLEGFGITNALAIGQYGLGGTTAPEMGIDTVGLPGGFYYFGAGNTSFGNNIGLVNIPYGAKTYAGQIGFEQGNIEPRVFVRGCKASNTWGMARELWHAGNFNPSLKADLATTLAGYGITNSYTATQIDTALNLKAPANNPILTGLPECPTAPTGSNNRLIANAAFVQKTVQDAITAVMDGAPGALDTLKELATALGNDPNFSTTILTALGTKADKATSLAGYGITDAVKTGQYGVGGSTAPTAAIDTVGLPGGFYYFGDGNTGFANNVGLVNIPYGNNGYAGQLGFRQGLVEPDIYVRGARAGGVWGNTRKLWHSGNLDPNTIMPPGTTMTFAGPTVPPGFLKENGAAVSRAAYANLFAAIGTTYGAGDGSTTFNLPDSRGEFIRGADDGRGVDPGRTVGSWADSQNKDHNHLYGAIHNNSYGLSATGIAGVSPGQAQYATSSSGGSESRPRSTARLMCIKY
ncbi:MULTISPECIES: phage tail protein [unclassified Pseudomonas]|uniref:phage tail-collar fiber domain-containing protein n=1 Tax=unclassified Pseudomonas TaxID=196821 RepID=UPI000C86ACE5|nr:MULTISPECIES: phage tail protein [unclassified Pseudomonas]PMU25090.1 phage tail protein [Pseudomonas sp. GP01-A9]PMU30268.1 phage tail protein [Pseudomonas sp. GP01-A13]PMU42187.1 phage tail protein [Pseudomonas sp. GP01-A8]PMU50684.1 phage tail protein [Pseudomonas sp. GP01-A14]PMU55331.1 phage tail protein [Pseudomonas sp. GP01-A6]